MGILALSALVLHLGAAAAPLTLDDALALAARRNPELSAARADADVSAAEARQAFAGVLPRLDVNGGFGHQWQGAQEQVNVVPNPAPPPDFIREAVTFPANDFGAHQLGIGATWTIFDGLANWSAISASRSREAATRRLYDESALRISFEVTRRFYEVVKQQRGLEVRRETAALSKELVDRADALFSAGRGTKADTFSARVNLGNDEIAVQQQQAVVARVRADLASVVGLASPEGLDVAPPDNTAPGRAQDVRHPPALPELLTHARKGRPLIAARRLETEAAYSDITRARGAYYPTIGLTGSYQKQSPDLTGTNAIFGNPSKQYVALAQVTVAWNLFAGGETRAGVDRAGALARRAEAIVEQQEQLTAAEVATARELVVALADSFATVQRIQEEADRALRFARERLEAGVGSQLEVRDAALKVTQARLTWVDTVADLAVARADLNRAVGGSL